MFKGTFTAIIAGTLLLLPITATMAQQTQKKEPLTLKKIGKDIGHVATRAGRNVAKETKRIAKNGEYGVRKGGENVSVTTHRTIGRNSTVRNRGEKKTDVVKPDGTHITKKKG